MISIIKVALPAPPFDWVDESDPGTVPAVAIVPIASIVGYAGSVGSTAGYDDTNAG